MCSNAISNVQHHFGSACLSRSENYAKAPQNPQAGKRASCVRVRHLVAVTQIRMTNSEGRRYYDRKIDQGKTQKEAMRCLKPKIGLKRRIAGLRLAGRAR